MKAVLVRVGADQAYGGWNAPVDPASGRFVYVPIPEKEGTSFRARLERSYREVLPLLTRFGSELNCAPPTLPRDLLRRSMHLDPDFEWLTYGDNGDRRGAAIKSLGMGDLLVFYAGLRPIFPSQRLLYALVGLFVVDEVVPACRIPAGRWLENAHTRKLKIGVPDIVVRAKGGVSGRLTRCLPIGEWRNGAYRVRRDLLDEWGGLSVRDGFIQRSARLPSFINAKKFYNWFLRQDANLIHRNNE